jgi:hypothetical protein
MKNMKKPIRMGAALAVAGMLIAACGAAAPAEPTQDPNMIFTQVAETVQVSMTQTAEALPPTPEPEPTPTPEPTLPPEPTVDPSLPTQTPFVQAPVGPTPTIQRFGDSAQWLSQSPMDGKVFKAGEQFTQTICMGNNGSTIWNSKYVLEWISGNRLWSNTRYFYVEDEVKPGGKWCFTLPAVAPYNPGSYMTRWYMKNPDGQFMAEVYFAYNVQ